MSQLYIAYDAEVTSNNWGLRSVGADLSLEKLINRGIFLQMNEAYIFLCSVDRKSGPKPLIRREAFVGSFCPKRREFKPADQVLTQLVAQAI